MIDFVSQLQPHSPVAVWADRALFAHVVANIVIFAIALGRFFTRPAGVAPAMRLLSGAGLASTIVVTWVLATTRRAPLLAVLVGLTCCALSLWIFAGAVAATRERRLSLAFSPDMPEYIISAGPYAHIRHPFYTSYALTWLGAAIGTWHPASWAVVAVMLTLYFLAARREEAKFDASALKADYASYKARAGMFWPHFPQRGAARPERAAHKPSRLF